MSDEGTRLDSRRADRSHAELVLARRARFVAAALAATGLGGVGCSPCLSVEPGPDTGGVDAASDTSAVCLAADAMFDTGFDTGSVETGSPETGSPETGSPETGSPETGSPDAGSSGDAPTEGGAG